MIYKNGIMIFLFVSAFFFCTTDTMLPRLISKRLTTFVRKTSRRLPIRIRYQKSLFRKPILLSLTKTEKKPKRFYTTNNFPQPGWIERLLQKIGVRESTEKKLLDELFKKQQWEIEKILRTKLVYQQRTYREFLPKQEIDNIGKMHAKAFAQLRRKMGLKLQDIDLIAAIEIQIEEIVRKYKKQYESRYESTREQEPKRQVTKSRMEALTVLELSETATRQEIKKQFLQLAKKHHPDRYQDLKEKIIQEEILKKIIEAYEFLESNK